MKLFKKQSFLNRIMSGVKVAFKKIGRIVK